MDLEAGESAAFHRSERELSGLGLCVVAGIGVKTSYLSNHDAAHLYQRPRLQIEEGRRARPRYGVLLRARLVPMWLAAFLLGGVGSLAYPLRNQPSPPKTAITSLANLWPTILCDKRLTRSRAGSVFFIASSILWSGLESFMATPLSVLQSRLEIVCARVVTDARSV